MARTKAGTSSPPPKQPPVSAALRHSPRIASTAASHASQKRSEKPKKKRGRETLELWVDRLDSSKFNTEEGKGEDDDATDDSTTATGVGAKRAAPKGQKALVPRKKAASKTKSRKRKKGDGDESKDSDDSDDNLQEEDNDEVSSVHKIQEVEEKNEDADDVVEDDLLAVYQDEKDLIEDCIKVKPKNLTSPIWSKVLFIDTAAVLQCCDGKIATAKNYEGIKKIQEHINNSKKTSLPVVCSICFYSRKTSLKLGVVMLHTKKGRSKAKDAHDAPQTSNFLAHLKTRRDDPHKAFLDDLNAKSHSDRSVATQKSGASTVSLAHSAFTEWSSFPKAQIITRMHQLLYLVINDANIPAHIIRNHRLWDFVEYIAANGKSLQGTSRNTLMMGRHKFNSIQAVSFADMISVIERLIDDNRKYFESLTGRTIPFLYVGHDLWDGKNKNVLGLCIFMVSHLLQKMIAFPVGILRSREKKAEKVAEQALKALKR
jgi:hypothetical protein